MKKQSLLAAVALTTVAVAGAAQAQQYSLGVSNDAKLTAATVKAPVTVASEVKLDPASNAKGIVGLALTPSAGAILPTGNSKLTFALTGGHTFGTAVTPGAIVAGAACTPTTVISSGGLAGGNEVTFLISNLGGCNNSNPILVQLPVQLANTTTALGVNSAFTTELGTSIDGGSKNITNVVKFAKAFSVEIKADTTANEATLASGFKALSNGVLGTIDVKADTAVLTGIQNGAAAVSQADITNAKYTIRGNASTVDITVAGATPAPLAETTKGSGILVGNTANPAAGAKSVSAAVLGTPVPVVASAYTAEVDLTLAAAFNAQPTYGPTALESITRQGSTYLLPWVASQTLVGSSQNETIVRISNIGAAPTGQVSAELLTSSTGVPASTALVPLAASIAKGGELVITSGTLQTAFGADFGRGDVRITVEAQPATVVARRFIRNVVTNALTELSLGRDAHGNEPQN